MADLHYHHWHIGGTATLSQDGKELGRKYACCVCGIVLTLMGGQALPLRGGGKDNPINPQMAERLRAQDARERAERREQ